MIQLLFKKLEKEGKEGTKERKRGRKSTYRGWRLDWRMQKQALENAQRTASNLCVCRGVYALMD
jgi:hypothetical protein